MTITKKLGITAVIIVGALTLVKLSSDKLYTVPTVEIGIIKGADHSAFDRAAQGLLDKLHKAGLAQKVLLQSAQGNPATAMEIARLYRGRKVKVLVTMGTTATQAALAVYKGDHTGAAIVFICVTDPVSAQLLEGGCPITGVKDFVPVVTQLEFFKALLQKEHLHIGVIYSAADPNSVHLVEAMQALAARRSDITFAFVTASKTSEVAAAAEQLLRSDRKIDAIFINNDNTALNALSSVVRIATKAKIPVLCSDVDTIPQGVLASLGPNQYMIGQEGAGMVLQILQGVRDIPVRGPTIVEKYVNQPQAAILGIKLDAEWLKQSGVKVYE